jgi:hypothetical protein
VAWGWTALPGIVSRVSTVGSRARLKSRAGQQLLHVTGQVLTGRQLVEQDAEERLERMSGTPFHIKINLDESTS